MSPSMSVHPAGVQVKVVASVPAAGVMATLVMEGAVLLMTTAVLVAGEGLRCYQVAD